LTFNGFVVLITVCAGLFYLLGQLNECSMLTTEWYHLKPFIPPLSLTRPPYQWKYLLHGGNHFMLLFH